MIRNYLKIAFRYLNTNKTYTFINLTGLTLGFLCFLMLNAYVSSEKSYDTQHGYVFRLLQNEKTENGEVREIATLGPRIGYAAEEKFPEIIAATEVAQLGRLTVGNDPGKRSYERMTAIDDNFFQVFQFHFVEGNEQQAFTQPNGVVLTQSIKEKYFGQEEALGKMLFTNVFEAVVAGVVEDFPSQTHLEGGLLIPNQTSSSIFGWWDEFIQTNWHRNSFVTYLKLERSTSPPQLADKITQLCKNNWPTEITFNSTFTLQPVRDIHLYAGDVKGEINKSKGNPFYTRIFFWIALVILLVACFNYTGLLNVAYMSRSKEIGIRKVVGAQKRQLLVQFLLESLLLTLLGLLFAFCLLYVLAPFLPTYFGPAFNINAIPPQKLIAIAVLGLVISLGSIAYPAYLISRLAVVDAFKRDIQHGYKIPFRKVIIVFQFVAAISLIACTSILYRQINYLQQKELGFDMGGMVIVDINSNNLRNQFQAIKQEFSKIPEVRSVSVSSRVPGEWKVFPYVQVSKEGQELSAAREMIFIAADKDFTSTYNIQLKQGQNFSGQLSDSTKVLLNQSAVSALGLEDPVGKRVEIPQVNWSGDSNPLSRPYIAQVVGIVQDFHFEDFRNEIQPMVIGFRHNPIHNIDYFSLQLQTDDWASTIASLRQVNDRFDPENPLEYNVLNDRFERFFEADIMRSHLLFFFSGIVIFIACLGLFAMTAFVLKNRTKEIGIRKVLGASAGEIVQMITADFLKLVLLGGLIAVPIAWLLMRRWLEEFAYHISLNWSFFAAALLVVLGIAFTTISIQSIKAAMVNPSESLKQE